MQIIGEAARALSEDARRLTTDIPRPKPIGMRNILVHGYFEIDTEIVWETVRKDIPALKPAVEALLRKLEEAGDDG